QHGRTHPGGFSGHRFERGSNLNSLPTRRLFDSPSRRAARRKAALYRRSPRTDRAKLLGPTRSSLRRNNPLESGRHFESGMAAGSDRPTGLTGSGRAPIFRAMQFRLRRTVFLALLPALLAAAPAGCALARDQPLAPAADGVTVPPRSRLSALVTAERLEAQALTQYRGL